MFAISLVVLLVLAAYATARLCGALHWRALTRDIHARLDAAREPVRPATVDFAELADLPAPVQRYFQAVLRPGAPVISAVRVRHVGTFNAGERTDNWRRFASEQKVLTRRPGFDWNARVAMVPGIPVRAHDAYVAGEGLLRVSLLGLVPVVDLRGTNEIAEGELMRFFAEAAWYPTAMLPSQGVHWEPAGDRAAYGTLADGTLRIRLRFEFDGAGLIERVRAQARGRSTGGRIVPTPWEGRFWNYAERGGMRVPLEGEVAWLLPQGPRPYWRGRIEEIVHEFAG